MEYSLCKSISVLIIVEFSTISLLDCFEDTLAHVGLPESWLEYELNDVTQIKNNYINLEPNWIVKNVSRILKKPESQIE